MDSDANPVVLVPGGASALVGRWRVESRLTNGVEIELALEQFGFSYTSGTLELSGSWRVTTDGLFVAHLTSIGGDGADGADFRLPPWLEPTRCRAEQDMLVLLDSQGQIVTRMRRQTGAVAAITLDDAPAPLPSHLEPATHERLAERWRPIENWQRPPTPPFLRLVRDHTWFASDGCNSTGGRWVCSDDGSVAVAPGPTTLVFCWGVPVASWWAQARCAGFDGEDLVLTESAGGELGRLERDW